MYFLFFEIIIASLLVNCQCNNNINEHTIILLTDKRCGTDNLLATLNNIRSRKICIGKCASLSECARVNYAKSSGICELIASSETTCTYIVDTDWSHGYFQCKYNHHRDCQSLRENGCRQNGVYSIKPDPSQPSVNVFCDMQDGGWTVIQRRYDGSVNFHKKLWDKYKSGFGGRSSEHWLGNDNIHLITNSAIYQIKFDLMTPDNVWHYALYSNFSITNEVGNYKLSLGPYVSGTATDGFFEGVAVENQLNGMEFSTSDRDNDLGLGVCTDNFNGAGWWYNHCASANLNMKYSSDGILYNRTLGIKWRGLTSVFGGPSLMATTMKLKREI